jgi:hypothetical protein
MPESSIQLGPSEEEKQRAFKLARYRLCPHCNAAISLADAISMVQGGGIFPTIMVETATGRKILLATPDINPQSVRIIEPND